jgi:hydroxymethylpyrimidine/phosphomethylpyrimidine kinase
MNVARALTIAGSDPGGGAGIQADLKTFTVLGTYGMSVITALTAQNTLGVSGVHPVPPEFVGAQLDAVLSDIGTDAAKTGMLFDVPIITVVAEKIRQYGVKNLVIDPVMIAKGGAPLLLPQAQAALRELLLPLAAVVTPNLPEAEALTGLTITTKAQMLEAGRRLLALGAGAAVIKGGHLECGPSDDVLVTKEGELWLEAERVESRHTHGTGCTFSAAMAAGLAAGLSIEAAARQAKAFITLAIRKAPGLGAGHGPTNHLAWLEERK